MQRSSLLTEKNAEEFRHNVVTFVRNDSIVLNCVITSGKFMEGKKKKGIKRKDQQDHGVEFKHYVIPFWAILCGSNTIKRDTGNSLR